MTKQPEIYAGPGKLRARWADVGQHAGIRQELAERGIDFPQGAAQADQSDADSFDLMCNQLQSLLYAA